MSHSNFFQLDLLAVFVIKVGSHNAMFYDVVLKQCERLLCSVQNEKNTYKNTKYVFYVPYQRWVFTCFTSINAFELCFWYNEIDIINQSSEFKVQLILRIQIIT